MAAIYQPQGKAREYSEFALNLYTGCSHACRYCYCPAIMRQTLTEWAANPHPRKNILRQVEKDAGKMSDADKAKDLLLCFMSDPYQSEAAAILTREALTILEGQGFKAVNVLTKAGSRAVNDFDILGHCKWKFGSTIIMQNEAKRQYWEPGASSIASRYEAVKEAHRQGIYTWVSVEPVIDTGEALQVITDLLPYVSFWKVGKLNHNAAIEEAMDWGRFYKDVKTLLRDRPHLIKKDLKNYAEDTF